MEDIIIEERPATPVSTKEPAKTTETKVKIKIKKQGPGVLSYLADWFNKSLIVFLLAAINLVLFLSVGNLNAFRGAPWELVPEVSYVLLGLFVLSWLLMFAASLARFIQNLVAAALVGFWFVVLVNQFALFDADSFLYNLAVSWFGEAAAVPFANYSQWIAAALIFLVSWVFFTFAAHRKQFYLVVILAAIALISGVQLYNQRNNMSDFEEVYADKVITNNKQGNNFVFIAVPNLPSYRYLESISPKYKTANKALKAMLGLYTRNGFVLFPNAYTLGQNEAENLAQSLNLSIDKDLLSRPAKYAENWDFDSLAAKRTELKSSQMLATFEKNGYVRKVFEDNSVELCFVDAKPVANACYRRKMVPMALEAEKFSLRQRIMLLVGQWLGSMDMFTLNRPLYNVLKSFNVADVPFIGQDYAEQKALGSVETLDKVAEDIAQGKGNRAYVVWMNLPGQGFVYDEFCQLKPVDKWIVKGGTEKDEDKQINAYFEQTACLFGKLNDFMRQLKENKVDKNTVVILQGVSGLEIAGLKPADKFEAENMVTMAVRDPKHTKFTLDNRFCSAPKIVRQYLFKKDECREQEGLNLDENVKNEIVENIKKQNVISNNSLNTLTDANEWFRNWLRANYPDMVIPIEMPVIEEKEVADSKLQNPQQAKEQLVKQETKTIAEAAKEEAEKVKAIKLRTDETSAPVVSEDNKSVSDENALSQPQNLLENAGIEKVPAPQEKSLATGKTANDMTDKSDTENQLDNTTEPQVQTEPEEKTVKGDELETSNGAEVQNKPENADVEMQKSIETQAQIKEASQPNNLVIGEGQKPLDQQNDKSAEENQQAETEPKSAVVNQEPVVSEPNRVEVNQESEENKQNIVETGVAPKEANTITNDKPANVESKTAPAEEIATDEKVVIIPQGDDKSDKIIIKIGTEEDNLPQEQETTPAAKLENLTAEIIAKADETKDKVQNEIADWSEIKAPQVPLKPENFVPEIQQPKPEMLIPQPVPQQDEIDENVLFERNDSALPEPDETTQN